MSVISGSNSDLVMGAHTHVYACTYTYAHTHMHMHSDLDMGAGCPEVAYMVSLASCPFVSRVEEAVVVVTATAMATAATAAATATTMAAAAAAAAAAVVAATMVGRVANLSPLHYVVARRRRLAARGRWRTGMAAMGQVRC